MMIDLHSHYPMHVATGEGETLKAMLNTNRPNGKDKWRARVLELACKIADYQGPHGGAAVTVDTLRASNVRAALSVLYVPWDEMDFALEYASPPRNSYITDLLAQMDQVEASVAGHPDVVFVRTAAQLDEAVANGKVALIHCMEGGFHLGDTPGVVEGNVAALAFRGLAYITIAHLFFRKVATNAPALPFISDTMYSTVFPQPSSGLTDLGRAAIRAMVANRVLVDVTHMSRDSFFETMRLLDEIDPSCTVPVLASHGAVRMDGLDYNLADDQIMEIKRRNGVIGLIACAHYMSKGVRKSKNFQESASIIFSHIDKIREVTGSYDHIAIGSDQDGFIKPTLCGLETPVGLGKLEAELAIRFNAAVAKKICWDNARRMLGSWGAG